MGVYSTWGRVQAPQTQLISHVSLNDLGQFRGNMLSPDKGNIVNKMNKKEAPLITLISRLTLLLSC